VTSFTNKSFNCNIVKIFIAVKYYSFKEQSKQFLKSILFSISDKNVSSIQLTEQSYHHHQDQNKREKAPIVFSEQPPRPRGG